MRLRIPVGGFDFRRFADRRRWPALLAFQAFTGNRSLRQTTNDAAIFDPRECGRSGPRDVVRAAEAQLAAVRSLAGQRRTAPE
jgi:hypothetical protein